MPWTSAPVGSAALLPVAGGADEGVVDAPRVQAETTGATKSGSSRSRSGGPLRTVEKCTCGVRGVRSAR